METPNLIFNLDGTIDEAQLEGFPEEIKARILSPEFQANIRASIKRDRDTGRRASRRTVKFTEVRSGMRLKSKKLQRPEGLSGRQWKRVRKGLRKFNQVVAQ